MPMHPECRQEDLEKHGFNAAISMFLPMMAMEGKQEYMRRYYKPELEAEDKAAREAQFEALVADWSARRREADAAGRAFEEPFPRYPQRDDDKEESWWERALGPVVVWLFDLPLGKYLVMALIAIGLLLTFWIVIPAYMVHVQRQWKGMLRRDREYDGDAVCDHCGARFARGARPGAAGTGGRLPGH